MEFVFALKLNEVPINLFLSLLRCLWLSCLPIYNLLVQFAKIWEVVSAFLQIVHVSNNDIKECWIQYWPTSRASYCDHNHLCLVNQLVFHPVNILCMQNMCLKYAWILWETLSKALLKVKVCSISFSSCVWRASHLAVEGRLVGHDLPQ